MTAWPLMKTLVSTTASSSAKPAWSGSAWQPVRAAKPDGTRALGRCRRHQPHPYSGVVGHAQLDMLFETAQLPLFVAQDCVSEYVSAGLYQVM